ncbi:hypothetical protein C6V83_10270 [Gordonia iterans]|uniref:Uncharacterized protein n=1 Tax=Gordonia iterans TaxID=1004901 RepID=A0A2S0KFX5_9ACTN|nr:hypothetical protein [Gordonia iterans]AVM00598.1 hypothetical protein C6V83_10270 [Gordonia iterans]
MPWWANLIASVIAVALYATFWWRGDYEKLFWARGPKHFQPDEMSWPLLASPGIRSRRSRRGTS